MTNIYVVIGSNYIEECEDCNDLKEWPIAAYLDESLAEIHVKNAEKREVEIRKAWAEYLVAEHPNRLVALSQRPSNKWDPSECSREQYKPWRRSFADEMVYWYIVVPLYTELKEDASDDKG